MSFEQTLIRSLDNPVAFETLFDSMLKEESAYFLQNRINTAEANIPKMDKLIAEARDSLRSKVQAAVKHAGIFTRIYIFLSSRFGDFATRIKIAVLDSFEYRVRDISTNNIRLWDLADITNTIGAAILNYPKMEAIRSTTEYPFLKTELGLSDAQIFRLFKIAEQQTKSKNIDQASSYLKERRSLFLFYKEHNQLINRLTGPLALVVDYLDNSKIPADLEEKELLFECVSQMAACFQKANPKALDPSSKLAEIILPQFSFQWFLSQDDLLNKAPNLINSPFIEPSTVDNSEDEDAFTPLTLSRHSTPSTTPSSPQTPIRILLNGELLNLNHQKNLGEKHVDHYLV